MVTSQSISPGVRTRTPVGFGVKQPHRAVMMHIPPIPRRLVGKRGLQPAQRAATLLRSGSATAGAAGAGTSVISRAPRWSVT